MTGDYKRQRAAKVEICRNQQSNKEPKNTDFTGSVALSGKRKRKADESEPDESVGRVGSQEYLVEKILGTQIVNDTREYFVKWLGWDSSYNSWEPEENMTGCQEMVKEFMKKSDNQKVTLNKVSLRTSVAVKDVILQEGRIANRDKLYKVPQTGDIKQVVEKERKMNFSKVSISSNEKSAVNDVNSISKSNGITQNALTPKAPITISKPVIPTVKVGLQVSPQKQMKILQQENVITVDANFIIKANDNIKFEFVVTTKLDRNIHKIYNQSILSSDGNVYVLCEFEGSNLIEVVPKTFFKNF